MPYLIVPSEIQDPGSQLPVTGQTVSYTSGDDGHYQAGFDPATRFEEVTIGGIALVIDHATGLMWPKNLGQFHNNTKREWATAISILEASALAGFTDWRLTNINELGSIIDHGNGRAAAVFTGTYLTSVYWTSTTYRYNTANAYTFTLNGTSHGAYTKVGSTHYYVGVRNA